jgi:cell division protein FtsB
MSAAMLTAVAALIGAPVAGIAAVYGSRVAGRVQREGGVIKGYDKLTDQLQEERESDRQQIADLRTDLAAERLESARLRLLVQQLGGAP